MCEFCTEHGEGKVLDTQILTQLVLVEYDDTTRAAVRLDELKVLSPNSSTTQSADENDNGTE